MTDRRRPGPGGGLRALMLTATTAMLLMGPGPALPALAAADPIEPSPSQPTGTAAEPAQQAPAPAQSAPSQEGAPGAGDPRTRAQEWMNQEGITQVRQHTGEQGEVSVGEPVAVHAWDPGFLDGSRPEARPVATGSWAAPVTAGGEPAGVLLVSVDGEQITGEVEEDKTLAMDMAAATTGIVVHDSSADAWYSVSGQTVTALGTRAASLLAGPVDLVEYGHVLRERAEAHPTASPPPAVRPESGDWAVWGPVLGVVAVGVITVVVTIRHERKVTAPLRQRPATPVGADTIPESHIDISRLS
ncbi:hypothetical protein J5X07_05230 [Actinomyces bowdenii]|uniref:Uncharacterized protein n=1 Tax=Actinomyces bowdenii TaxID=131109 RepID=A0A3P1V901_9ACTO|nr:hypothetical protein [Actinomyces bowdenii]MBO3724437.1 hypothetical protein [Actinomyces bowdenii]RRD30692.1 hypothetical protein EII10_00810 [Actinomyces bowdenii]